MKAVIVAAGYGTRFLPITKTIPKEMLPLYDKPLLDLILDELEEAGIKDVIFITSRRKKMMEDYLDREIELETELTKSGKTELIDSIKPRDMNIVFIRQKEMKGTGQAILMIKDFVAKDEAFIVVYPDDIIISRPSLSKNLIDLYNKTGKNILTVREEHNNISRYGVIKPLYEGEHIYVDSIIEKPSAIEAPSNLVSMGRYLFTYELLELLEKGYKQHTKGEYYHIDSINELAKNKKVLAYKTEGLILDTGEPYSYLYSLMLYAKNHPEAKKLIDRFYKENY